MIYTQLSPTYKDDLIAEALYAREVEFFHYEFDAKNFEYLLATLPEGEYRTSIQQLFISTQAEMAKVEASVAALRAQITDNAAHVAAVLRAMEKRKVIS